MEQERITTKSDKWTAHYASMMQKCWKKDIEEAIVAVKGDVPARKREGRRRKQGFWTPTGFTWFRRNRKWRNDKRRDSNGKVALPWKKR